MTRCQYDGGVLAWSDRQYASMEAGHVEVCPYRRAVYDDLLLPLVYTDSPMVCAPPPAWAAEDCAGLDQGDPEARLFGACAR